MRVTVITSCTGIKKHGPEEQLQQSDFRRIHDSVSFSRREDELKQYLLPAEEMYLGQQHLRLLDGVRVFRGGYGAASADLHILSAGYGLIPGDRVIAPYNLTFQGMKKKEVREWADFLNIPAQARDVFSKKSYFTLVLLGDSYLQALNLDETTVFASPTLFLTSVGSMKSVKGKGTFRVVPLTNEHASAFSCGLVGLKGEIAKRLLSFAVHDPHFFEMIFHEDFPFLEALSRSPATSRKKTKSSSDDTKMPVKKPELDYVVSIPKEWWNSEHKKTMRYFIPEWDDLVDRDFDFLSDTHSGGQGSWDTEVYAHQMFDYPNYDGILVSKVVAEKSKSKKQRINRLGVHRYLRLPPEFPIMGDCGAFGYVDEDVPPYTTGEILDYYTRLGFDYAVSIDHMIVKATESQWKERYEITMQNAADFIREHRKAGLSWTPVGAVQGWSPETYAEAVKAYVKMGYKYLGLGGLARTNTRQILAILQEIHPHLPADVGLHLFGVARLNALDHFKSLGVRSVDSASYLRRAWLGAGQNYFTLEGEQFAAIRIPEVGKSFRAKRMVSEGRATEQRAADLESKCLASLRAFDKGLASVDEVLDILREYDVLIGKERIFERDKFERVLRERPWKKCPCPICRKDGIEVIIFRGNNRNRRRGFHNTFVFYRLFRDILEGKTVNDEKQLRLDMTGIRDEEEDEMKDS